MYKIAAFTLLELLIVVAIIGIISSIAYPSYQAYVLKTRRGNAITELIQAQLQQTQVHILNPSYSSDIDELGLTNSDDYSYSVISASTTTYSLKAVAKGAQSADTGCTILTIDQSNNQTPINCW